MFDEVVKLITEVGFPIACCVVLFVQQGKLTKTIGDLNGTLQVINARLDNIEDSIKKAGDKDV